ncbi:type II CAAX prenyl endopeptidase Rce1 family protein [Aquimarina aquimarini]|uniref:CPBP family glutamic-type intramembrane protease n=1 Tax=Aquimarina aquimarini TaxID=1191734 RepID=UPI000D55A9EC|nr:CPBP family glutamic-type intramembrane protease [Aquimarina aquimarini]
MNTLTNWKEFFQFLKKPNYLKQTEGIKNKSLLTFNSLLLNILLIIPLLLLYAIYLYSTGELNDNMNENVEKLYHPIILYSMVAIFEEFAFRGFLTKFKPLLFSISITGIFSYYYKKTSFNNMFFEPEGLIETGIFAIMLFLILYFIGKKYNSKLIEFWNKNFSYIVYFSAFLFAFLHFFNSKELEIGYLKTIIFQLIGAFILSFVRIRAGILYAIVLHFIFDIIL